MSLKNFDEVKIFEATSPPKIFMLKEAKSAKKPAKNATHPKSFLKNLFGIILSSLL